MVKSDHPNIIYWAVVACGTVYKALQGSSNLWVVGTEKQFLIVLLSTKENAHSPSPAEDPAGIAD